jgi:hypothetical protein
MSESFLVQLALIAVLGIGAPWHAWRLASPVTVEARPALVPLANPQPGG